MGEVINLAERREQKHDKVFRKWYEANPICEIPQADVAAFKAELDKVLASVNHDSVTSLPFDEIAQAAITAELTYTPSPPTTLIYDFVAIRTAAMADDVKQMIIATQPVAFYNTRSMDALFADMITQGKD